MDATPATTESLVAEIDRELQDFLLDRARALADAEPLIAEIQRVLRAGGKRLRPAFCYWGFRAAGGEHGSEIVRAAASLELLHTFAIVHDDVMDSTEMRRGEPTTHARHGIGMAILTGDLALVLADSLFGASGFPPESITAALVDYDRMRQEVIAGQLLDMRLAGASEVTEEQARRVAVLKSGRYSVAEPLTIGARLAGGDAEVMDVLAGFGAPLGEAFQLRDDLLGVFGDPSVTGKPSDSDAREGKRHVLYAKTVAGLGPDDRTWFVEHWGGGDALGPAEIARLNEMMEVSGARRATEASISELLERALSFLERTNLDGDAERALRELASSAAHRQV